MRFNSTFWASAHRPASLETSDLQIRYGGQFQVGNYNYVFHLRTNAAQQFFLETNTFAGVFC